jgi:Fic family protein
MPVAYKWMPITDLGQDPRSLTDGELDSLQRVWVSQKKELIENGALEEFDKRLWREWSIETGIIENVYTLDRGITRTLIQRGIDAALIPHGASNRDSTLVARIIQDHYDALAGMFDFIAGKRELSVGYIKELHAALLRNQRTYEVVDQFGTAFEKTIEKGAYKTEPNSPLQPDGAVHAYCPPEHVAAEMDNLVRMYTEHRGTSVPPEVEAAWLHHRFTQIHPFVDGNGRVARALASLVFIKANWFPLVVTRDRWTKYIDALEKADHENLRPLVALFVEAQRNALIQATEIALDIKPVESTEEAVAALRDRLVQRGKLSVKEWLTAETTARGLVQITHNRLGEIVNKLQQEISGSGISFGNMGTHSSIGNRVVHGVRENAIKKAGQIPDFERFHSLQGLNVNIPSSTGAGPEASVPSHLWISFHPIGPKFRGLIGVVAYLAPVLVDGNPATLPDPVLVGDGTFQINYEESADAAKARFTPWLERVIVDCLDKWRRTF